MQYTNRVFPWLITAVFLLSFTSVFALDCQYAVNETYQELLTGFFWINGSYFGGELIASNFTYSDYCSVPPTFKVYNPNRMSFKINVSYTIFHPAVNPQFPEGSSDQNRVIDLKEFSDAVVTGGCIYYTGANVFQAASIKYEVLEPTFFIYKTDLVTKIREACTRCNGVQCLSDGAECSADVQCGSGVCNIAHICGSLNSSHIVPCNSTQKNCNNNCLTPNVKEIGQAYSCDWECKTGVGKDGICKDTPMNEIMPVVYSIIFVLIIVTLFLFFFFRAKREKIKYDEALKNKIADLTILNKKYDKLKKEGEKRVGDLKKVKYDIEKQKNDVLESYRKLYGHEFELDEKGYVRFKKSFKYPDQKGLLLHRWLYEREKGKVPEGYEVHHKNKNKLDNRLENLEALSKEEHDRKHGKV